MKAPSVHFQAKSDDSKEVFPSNDSLNIMTGGVEALQNIPVSSMRGF